MLKFGVFFLKSQTNKKYNTEKILNVIIKRNIFLAHVKRPSKILKSLLKLQVCVINLNIIERNISQQISNLLR